MICTFVASFNVPFNKVTVWMSIKTNWSDKYYLICVYWYCVSGNGTMNIGLD